MAMSSTNSATSVWRPSYRFKINKPKQNKNINLHNHDEVAIGESNLVGEDVTPTVVAYQI